MQSIIPAPVSSRSFLISLGVTLAPEEAAAGAAAGASSAGAGAAGAAPFPLTSTSAAGEAAFFAHGVAFSASARRAFFISRFSFRAADLAAASAMAASFAAAFATLRASPAIFSAASRSSWDGL